MIRWLRKLIKDILWMPGRDLHDPQRGWKLPDGVDNGVPPQIDYAVKVFVVLYLLGLIGVLLYNYFVGF